MDKVIRSKQPKLIFKRCKTTGFFESMNANPDYPKFVDVVYTTRFGLFGKKKNVAYNIPKRNINFVPPHDWNEGGGMYEIDAWVHGVEVDDNYEQKAVIQAIEEREKYIEQLEMSRLQLLDKLKKSEDDDLLHKEYNKLVEHMSNVRKKLFTLFDGGQMGGGGYGGYQQNYPPEQQ